MRSCEACGSRELTVIFDDRLHEYELNGHRSVWRYRLVECAKCGLAFVDPKPEWGVLETFYDESYGIYVPAESEEKSIKYWIAKQRYAFLISPGLATAVSTGVGIVCEWLTGKTVSFTLGIPLQFPKDAHIFEMGFGSGSWLLGMSNLGYRNLYGYDIDSNSLDLSRLESAGISISQGNFLENDYSEGTFDCILLEHVFEHLSQPMEALSKFRKMLKPTGYLLINTPCKVSWSMALSLQHSPALQIPNHLYLHTPKSVSLMLVSTGFNVIKTKVYSVMAQLSGTINNKLCARGWKAIPTSCFVPLAPFYKLFGVLTGKGDFMTILARRGQ